jgi:hypothetical protein
MIANNSIECKCAEDEEEQKVRHVLQLTQIQLGTCVVIDSDGIQGIDG